MRHVPRPAAVLAWAAVAALVAYPLVRLAIEAPAAGVGSILSDPRSGEALAGSLATSVAAAVLATVVGGAAALVTERVAVAGRSWLRGAMVVPLLVPPFVSAISWQLTYAPGGVLDDIAGVAFPWVEGAIGVTVVIAVNAMPLAYLVAAASLASADELDAERAARVSGAGPWAVLRTVTLPLLRPALLAGAALGFVFGLNSFGVPIVLGTPAGLDTLTTEVYRSLVRSADPAAFERVVVLALLLAGLGLVAGLLADRRPIQRTLPTISAGRDALPPVRPVASWLAGSAVGLWSLVTLVVPFAGLAARSLVGAPGVDPLPANWSGANYASVLDDRLAAAFGRSLVLATAAALLVVALSGLTVSLARSGRPGPGVAGSLGFALPGSALAVAVLLAFRVPLADTLAIILIAYLAKFWALGHRTLAGAAGRLGDAPMEAARASGASARSSLLTIALPALAPAIAAGALLVFSYGIHELTMSSLLHGPGTDTLAVVILDTQQLGDAGLTAALAVVLTALVVLPAVPLGLARRAWRGRAPE